MGLCFHSQANKSLMTETLAQSALGRLMPISDVKLQNMTTQKSTSYYKPAKRVLDFSLMEGNDGLDIRVNKLESGRARHEFDSISESSRGCSEDCDSSSSVALPQEAEESLGCSLEKTNQFQAGLDTWHKKSSSLLDLVNVIHSIFQYVKRTPITKEELLQKIIMNSLDFVQIREVEEQVEFLEKLVPDWICKKSVPTGDIMYCYNNRLSSWPSQKESRRRGKQYFFEGGGGGLSLEEEKEHHISKCLWSTLLIFLFAMLPY